jgi:glycosyltransferase involved in cell wall biosynthesis
VHRLNADGRATVHVDIPAEAHHELVANASVYVLALAELSVSSGHIRLMEAVGAMTPVVATRVLGLADYIEPGASALVVEPGDAGALRDAVDRVLGDEALGRRLAEDAIDRFGERSFDNYLSAVAALVASADDTRGRGSTRTT